VPKRGANDGAPEALFGCGFAEEFTPVIDPPTHPSINQAVLP